MQELFPQKYDGPPAQGGKLILFLSVMASLTLDPRKGHCRIFGVQQGMHSIDHLYRHLLVLQ